VQAVRVLAHICCDDHIAGFLNRNGLRTGKGNRWTRGRVVSLRSHHQIPCNTTHAFTRNAPTKEIHVRPSTTRRPNGTASTSRALAFITTRRMGRPSRSISTATSGSEPPSVGPIEKAAQIVDPRRHLRDKDFLGHPWLSCAMRL
jgi:hypothetical protein